MISHRYIRDQEGLYSWEDGLIPTGGLADLYGAEARTLNQAVRSNIKDFHRILSAPQPVP